MLYVLNLISWFWPALFFSGAKRATYIFSAFLFSQSYYFQPMIYNIFGLEYSAPAVSGNLIEMLYLSVGAGLSYSIIFFFFAARGKASVTVFLGPGFNRLFDVIPRFSPVIFVCVFLAAYLIYNVALLIPYIGTMDRYQWWYGGPRNEFVFAIQLLNYLVPLSMVVLYKSFDSNYFFTLLVNILLATLMVFFISFDGSRREIVLTILALLVCAIRSYQVGQKRYFFIYSFFLILVLLFVFYVGSSRSIVGWYAAINFIKVDFSAFFLGAFAPMPTLHVTGAMIDYVNEFGYQGVGSYLAAVVNTLFPHFIMGFYVAGAPLVSRLHEELGWVGFDFGFMAEAVYVGGAWAVIIMHSILSMYHALLYNSVFRKSGLLGFLLLAFYHVALIQALRSDLMNLLKYALYPAISILLFFFILRMLKSLLAKS